LSFSYVFVIKKEKRRILFLMRLLRKLVWTAFLLLVICALIAFGYYLAMTKDAALAPEKLLLSDKNITVYDENLSPVKNVAAVSPKQTVGIESIPQQTKFAFVDTEDKRFFSHHGFDIRRIAKACLSNLKAGGFKEGASTISQQLIKNTHLSQEKTMKRKLQEWKLTKALEKRYSKDEILEKYLNTIYFGHSCFGIRAAAEFYFGKPVEALTLSESAILAGLVKSPNNYSPFKNPEGCKKRKTSVLNAMLKNGHITEKEKIEAIQTPLPKQANTTTQNVGYLHFVFDELSTLAEKYGFPVGGNIEIFTYLDQNLQSKTEELLSTVENCDKTALILDAKTHGYKACVSTVGNIRRLPGSLIKPLLVYAPALEENLLSPVTPILDEKINYNGYAPENYDGAYHGYVSARECVEKSLNIPAVKTLSALGANKGATYLEKLGLSVPKEDVSLALALGGMKNGYTLQEIVEAYTVFPSGKKAEDCGFISKITINGHTVYQKNAKNASVFSKESAYLMTDMLRTTTKNGTAKKLRSLPFDIAAKTGTVGTQKGNTDAYALSYTTRDFVGVWLGNKNNDKIEHTGGGIPCNLLLHINEYLYNDYQQKSVDISPFQCPKNVVCVTLDKASYYATHTIQLADPIAPIEHSFSELFKKSSIPLKTSDIFSKPTISTPVLSLKNGNTVIEFNENTPAYYQYKIDRYDYATHTTVYFGEKIPVFTDKNLQEGKSYIYTITPVYKNVYGNSVTLPAITTKPPSLSQNEREILETDWWKE